MIYTIIDCDGCFAQSIEEIHSLQLMHSLSDRLYLA